MTFCAVPVRGLASIMGEFRLSERADLQLDDIYFYGVQTFGVYQAEAYHSGLARIFGLIADFPLMGASADFVKVGLRRLRFQVHFVYYTVETDHVFIKGILPQRMNIRPDIFE